MEDWVLLARKTSVDIYLLHKFRIVNIYEEVIAWQNKLQSTVCALWPVSAYEKYARVPAISPDIKTYETIIPNKCRPWIFIAGPWLRPRLHLSARRGRGCGLNTKCSRGWIFYPRPSLEISSRQLHSKPHCLNDSLKKATATGWTTG